MAQAKMLSKKSSTLQGFTIIEVVLVLAIAGLIFLMVFIALPALQRNQRDTQRRQDYSALASQITTYTTNNNGSLPADNANLPADKYLNANGEDPRGVPYKIVVASSVPSAPAITDGDTEVKVYVIKQAVCDGGTPTTSKEKGATKRSFAVYAPTETGTYCQSNT
ncbi:type II secretion system protein [Candidatus Saccharibacteria bacterium]|nr:type II secretion system protein [Candidatus Saccharibacteria bacterium]MBR0460649.1 type II secretion system protein [Candidatus Saccharibacteria bacterium]